MTTNNIGSGQTYTTIQAWEDDTNVTSSPWIGVIQDNANFDETVTFAGGTGTPDITNHVRLEVAAGVRHLGVAGAGARIDNTSNATQAVLVSSDFVHIKDLEITRSGASVGSSDEGIRQDDGVSSTLYENLIVHTALAVADMDGFYTPNADMGATFLNCIFFGWVRAGIHYQQFSGGTDKTGTFNVDYCSIYNCGFAGEAESGAINVKAARTGTRCNINARNSAFMDTASTFDDWSVVDSELRSNWVCDRNITSDASQTARDANAGDVITNKLESKSIANVWTDAANGDFTVVASGDADGAGADLTGSKADSRGDYSVDIAGTTRHATTPSIGAFEISSGTSGSGAQTLPKLSQVGSGGQEFSGSGVQTPPRLSQAGSGVLQPEGSGAQTLPGLAQAGSGGETISGTGAQALPAVTQAGSGTHGNTITGTGIQTIPPLAQSGASVQEIPGGGAQALPAAVQAGTGLMQPETSGAQALPSVVQAGAGAHGGGTTGSGAQNLPAVGQAGSGVELYTGTADSLLPGLRQSGAAAIELPGSAALSLPTLVQSGTQASDFVAGNTSIFANQNRAALYGDEARITGYGGRGRGTSFGSQT